MADAPVVLGAGGHARVVVDALPGGVAGGHVSPEPATDARLGPHLGGDHVIAALAKAGHGFVLGLGFVDGGGARRRAGLLEQLAAADADLVTVVHAAATVSASASIGPGAFVAAGAVLGPDVRIGRGSIVNTRASVDHDCVIGDNVHIAPGAVLSGGVRVGADSLIGVGAVVIQGITIGAGVVVGAGAVVVADLPDGVIARGVPAKVAP